MNVLAILGIVLFLAFLVESMVEYFVGEVANHIPAANPYKWLIMYVAAIVGILAAFIYKLDLVNMLSDFLGVQFATTTFGIIFTGLVIGRGANFVHDLWQKFFVKPSVSE
jgi:magnesium-transporting ATPase (P-type)